MTSIGINIFAHCHLEPAFEGTRLNEKQMEDIRTLVEEAMNDGRGWDAEGYAPFCRVVTIPTSELPESCKSLKKTPYARITKNNYMALKSGYKRRRSDELPILKRWFVVDDTVLNEQYDVAKVEVILYTKAQLVSEGEEHSGKDFDIITIKAEGDVSSPMCPHTMMVNHLGTGFGGSGKQVDRDAYQKSADFWENHAFVGI